MPAGRAVGVDLAVLEQVLCTWAVACQAYHPDDQILIVDDWLEEFVRVMKKSVLERVAVFDVDPFLEEPFEYVPAAKALVADLVDDTDAAAAFAAVVDAS